MNITYYIATIITTLIFGLFLASWISVYRKREMRRKIYHKFDEVVLKNSLQIDKKQILHKNIIGIDRRHSILVFNFNSSPQKEYLITLGEICDHVN